MSFSDFKKIRHKGARKMKQNTQSITFQKVKLYEHILPICSVCKKIRDDSDKEYGKGDWKPLEEYLKLNVGLDVSHGMCQECSDKLYGGQEWYDMAKKDENLTD